MALTELQLKLIDCVVGAMCRHRSPEHLKDQLRIVYKINGYAVEVYEERPGWKNPEQWISLGVAKFLYTVSTAKWKLYWMRQDLKWHHYTPVPESKTIERLVAEVDRDPHGAFFG